MHRWGNRTQVLASLWILAGLLVIGANGYVLASLLDEPLSGYSTAVRIADREFRQYRTLLAAETEKITFGMDRLAHRFAPKAAPPPAAENKTVTTTVEKKRTTPRPVILPTLAGIVTRRSGNGTVNRLALLDGGVFSVGDIVQDYTVKGISAGKVLLTKGKKTWSIKAPQIAYSLTAR